MRSWIVAVVAVGVLSLPAACGQTLGADRAHEARPPEPARCHAERTQPPIDHRAGPDERMVAKELGVPVEEVQRQTALSDDVGRLGAALDKNERETFAELEIDDKPEFRVVVYFTRDGEETVRP